MYKTIHYVMTIYIRQEKQGVDRGWVSVGKEERAKGIYITYNTKKV